MLVIVGWDFVCWCFGVGVWLLLWLLLRFGFLFSAVLFGWFVVRLWMLGVVV